MRAYGRIAGVLYGVCITSMQFGVKGGIEFQGMLLSFDGFALLLFSVSK